VQNQNNVGSHKHTLLLRRNLRLAQAKWGPKLYPAVEQSLRLLSQRQMSIEHGDLLLIEGKWYVTHSGLLRLARRNRCCGINVRPAREHLTALATEGHDKLVQQLAQGYEPQVLDPAPGDRSSTEAA
jgi:hypothetical protein